MSVSLIKLEQNSDLGDSICFSKGDLKESLNGHLGENILYFAKFLRLAGLPSGPGQVLDAFKAILKVGLADKDDFYWSLYTAFVKRRSQHELFEKVFEKFWTHSNKFEDLISKPIGDLAQGEPISAGNLNFVNDIERTIQTQIESGNDSLGKETTAEKSSSWSAEEGFGQKDFEKMSEEEIQSAILYIRKIKLSIETIRTRRFRPSHTGKYVDMRRPLRFSLRSGSDFIALHKKEKKVRPPPLVVLCDISGSMDCYSRMFLNFMHVITNEIDRVHTFLFGTGLTNVTRQLNHKDPNVALGKVSEVVTDWSGGTRIGNSLSTFNRIWSKRVLTQRAIVLFISDGLDRDEANGLSVEMERLQKSCRRLIWLNPLLRYQGFEPKSVGIRNILPHVDEFKAIHNLDSFEGLANSLSEDSGSNIIKAIL